MDKQWLVQNSGTCNWTSIYRLKLVSGDPMGTQTEQALYPAKAGSQVTIRILFTAPVEAGHYTSSWQAFTSQGEAFGDPIFIDINVVGPP